MTTTPQLYHIVTHWHLAGWVQTVLLQQRLEYVHRRRSDFSSYYTVQCDKEQATKLREQLPLGVALQGDPDQQLRRYYMLARKSGDNNEASHTVEALLQSEKLAYKQEKWDNTYQCYTFNCTQEHLNRMIFEANGPPIYYDAPWFS